MGQNAIIIEEEGYYSGPTTCNSSITNCAAMLNNIANWTFGTFTFPGDVPNSITIPPNTAPTATAPTAPLVNEDAINVAISNNIQVADTDGNNQTVTFTVTGGTVTLGTAGITFGSDGNGSASFTASGTLAAVNTALDAATFTPTVDLNGANAGTISFTTNDGAVSSSPASVTFNITAVNDEPSFTAGANENTNQNAGAQTVNGWATNIDAGPADENGQALTFNVTNDNNALFSIQPAIDASGNLTYTPATNAIGSATVTVNISDDGGTANGGDDTSADQTFTITISDNIAPTITITSTESSPTAVNPIPITITFSEDVTGFIESDITVANGTISDFTSVSEAIYTFNINHSVVLSNSTITVNIDAAMAQDTAGNDNLAATEFAIVAVVPALHNETVDGDLSNIATIPTGLTFTSGANRIIGSVTTGIPQDTRDYITFTIPTGMQLSQILLQNYDDPAIPAANDGNTGFHLIDQGATTFEPGTGNPDDYLGAAHLSPLAPGTDILSILAGAPQAGAGFTAPLPAGTYTYEVQQTGPQISEYTIDFIVETETTPPTVTITSTESSPTAANPIPITITFSESVTDFDITDVTISNGTAGNFAGSGDTYTADIAPTATGTITVDINADAASDSAGNGNTAAIQFSIEFDNLLSVQDEILAAGLNIYPVPTSNTITIAGATSLQLKQVEIFDITGKLVVLEQLNPNNPMNTIDVSAIQAGLYLMNIQSETGSAFKRISKN